MKFAIGQHVCHPLYGPGQIVKIDEHIIKSKPQAYYVINILSQNLTTSIPMNAIDKVGLRAIISKKQTKKVFLTLEQEPQPLPTDHKQRQSQLKKWIFSGKPVQIAKAIRELSGRRFRRGNLNLSDKKLLEQGKEMLVMELAIAQGREEASVLALIDSSLESTLDSEQT